MHCTKPAGHADRGDPNHGTQMIPEPLSAVAAEMVAEHDRLMRERELFFKWKHQQARFLFISWIGAGTIAAANLVSLITRMNSGV